MKVLETHWKSIFCVNQGPFLRLTWDFWDLFLRLSRSTSLISLRVSQLSVMINIDFETIQAFKVTSHNDAYRKLSFLLIFSWFKYWWNYLFLITFLDHFVPTSKIWAIWIWNFWSSLACCHYFKTFNKFNCCAFGNQRQINCSAYNTWEQKYVCFEICFEFWFIENGTSVIYVYFLKRRALFIRSLSLGSR